MKNRCTIIITCLFLFYQLSAQTVTNAGTDFWVAFPPNAVDYTDSLFLFISSDQATSGTVYSAFPGVNQNFTVIPGVVTQLNLPREVSLDQGIEDKGIRVTSLKPISLYGLNTRDESTDAYLALPVNALGTDYRIASYTVNINTAGSGLSVVATQNGTSLTIFNKQSGATEYINLNIGQTYHLKSPNIGDDLTGSRVQSNFPVAVFGSVKYVYIPTGCSAADHIVEQMFPFYSWGKNYVTVPLAGRDTSGDIFRVIAGTDGTDIMINGTTITTINAGDFYETNLTGFNSIVTSEASLLAQYAKGIFCTDSITGDPFMMLIPPREQFLTYYTISTVYGFTSHWVNVVAPDYALGTIYQDGVSIPVNAFTQIGTTSFYGAQRQVTEDSHTFNSTFPFGIFCYGWNPYDSYGYAGGASLSPIVTVNSISLSPDTLYGQLNVTTVCFIAHVLNNLGNPVEGVLVNFNVSGIGPITGNAYTNAAGDAQYCYSRTGVTPGTDEIYAEVFGFVSDTSVVFWSSTPSCVNPVNGGNIGSDQAGCGTYLPVTLTNILPPTGQTGTLEYKWQISVTSDTTGFTDIPSSNFISFSPDSIAQTTWFKRLARVICMSNWIGAAESNVVELTTIAPLPVEMTVSVTANPVCAGDPVTFTATYINGGSSPVFKWYVNGINLGTNSPAFTYVPQNIDTITCTLTSSEPCTTSNPTQGNPIIMIVNPLLPVNITINSSSNPFCIGTSVTFMATPLNGGTTPAYQWAVNGAAAGTNSDTYTYYPSDGDQVCCTLTSSEVCTLGNPSVSNTVLMDGSPAPAVSFVLCFDTVLTTNTQPFRLRGGIPTGGVYSGPGVTAETGIFNPAVAGPGTKTIVYTYTNVALCTASATCNIQCAIPAAFSCGDDLTDIRDGKKYATVLIGSQCWMAGNLDYGNRIQSATHQRDNCIAEKYCFNDDPALCTLHAALYQWDELMRHEDTPGSQGLCPSGWHVPAEAEWNTLFANWTNSAFAGAPLRYTGYSGFDARLNGVNHLNRLWDFENFAVFFWSSTFHGPTKAWAYGMNGYNPSVSSYLAIRSNAFSVRCVRDN